MHQCAQGSKEPARPRASGASQGARTRPAPPLPGISRRSRPTGPARLVRRHSALPPGRSNTDPLAGRHRARLCVLLLPVLTLLAVAPAHGATINVDSGCDLHSAISAANGTNSSIGDCELGTSGHDTISLTADPTVPSNLRNAISQDLTINGNVHTITVRGSNPCPWRTTTSMRPWTSYSKPQPQPQPERAVLQ